MVLRKYIEGPFLQNTKKELQKMSEAIRTAPEDAQCYLYDNLKGVIICPKSKMFCGLYCPFLLLKNNEFNFLCSGVKCQNEG